MQRVEWVTDPNDEQVSPVLVDVLRAISSPRFRVHSRAEIPVGGGLRRYAFEVTEQPGPAMTVGAFLLPALRPLAMLQGEIGRIAFTPLVLRIPLEGADARPENVAARGANAAAMLEILRHWPGFAGLNAVVAYHPDAAVFRFSDDMGPVLLAADEAELLEASVRPSVWGARFVSASPLVWYAYDQLVGELPDDVLLAFEGGMALAYGRDGAPPSPVAVRRLQLAVTAAERSGQAFVPCSGRERALVLEICELWEMELCAILDEPVDGVVVRPPPDWAGGSDVADWFAAAVVDVRTGGLPRYTIAGPWMLEMDSTVENIARLAFAAARSVGLAGPFAALFAGELSVGDALAISGRFATIAEVRRLTEGILVALRDVGRWEVVRVEDVAAGALVRWKMAIDPAVSTLVVPVRGAEMLVADGPVRYEPPTAEDRAQLESILREYYGRRCADGGLDPVSLARVEELDLAALLTFVPTAETPPYCFELGTLERLPANPLTRAPWSAETLERLRWVPWAARGLVAFGPLPGLLPEIPELPRPMPPGKIAVTCAGEFASVEVVYADGTRTELFDIATGDSQALSELVPPLWRAGAFHSPWSSAYWAATAEPSITIAPPPPALSRASISPRTAAGALDYLADACLHAKNSASYKTT